MAIYRRVGFRSVTSYFNRPVYEPNAPGSIRFDTLTINKLHSIEYERGRRITFIDPRSPINDSRTNYSSPNDNGHWAWNGSRWLVVSARTGNWIGQVTSEDIPPPPSPTATPTITPTNTPTVTPSVSVTPSISISVSATPTPTCTPTPNPTPSVTASVTPTPNPTPSTTPTQTPTPSVSLTHTPTPSITVSLTASLTPTSSITITPTQTLSNTPTRTSTSTPTVTPTQTATPTKTPTRTPTPTPTRTATPTPTPSETSCPAPSPTPSITPNLALNDCIIQASIGPLISSHRYKVNIFSNDYDSITKIVPSEIEFVAKYDGNQDITLLLTRLESSDSATVSIRVLDLETHLEDSKIVVVKNDNCGCATADCPIVSPTPSPSPDVRSSINFAGCIDCDPTDYAFIVTTVGTNGRQSGYGTFDQNGNVWEWTESTGDNTLHKVLRGGSYASSLMEIDAFSLSSRYSNNFDQVSSQFGFRIASYNNPLDIKCFADVNEPCNLSSSLGFGRVKYSYKIHKYEVTNYEFIAFLNSVAFDQSSDHLRLYHQEMEDDNNGGIIRRFNPLKDRYEYYLKQNMDHKPVNFVTWLTAIRYCNWLHNNFGDTEDGAYSIPSDVSPRNIHLIKRNNDAKYFLPTDNEWYKAAYYNPIDSRYYRYATQSNKQPVCPLIDSLKNGPFPRDAICECPSIEICDATLTDKLADGGGIFILDMLRNPSCCCNVEYRLIERESIDIYVGARTPSWKDTFIDIVDEEELEFGATGVVYYPSSVLSPSTVTTPVPLQSGPNGISNNLTSCKLQEAQHLPSLSLIGKIGENGSPFFIGSDLSLKAAASGRLYLAINHINCIDELHCGLYYVNIKHEVSFADWQRADASWVDCSPYQYITLPSICTNLIP